MKEMKEKNGQYTFFNLYLLKEVILKYDTINAVGEYDTTLIYFKYHLKSLFNQYRIHLSDKIRMCI